MIAVRPIALIVVAALLAGPVQLASAQNFAAPPPPPTNGSTNPQQTPPAEPAAQVAQPAPPPPALPPPMMTSPERIRGERARAGGTDGYDVAAVGITLIGMPLKAMICVLSIPLAGVLLISTFGSADKATAAVVAEGCGQNWIVTGDDIRPDSGRY